MQSACVGMVSNTAMDTPDRTDSRITELEIKASFLEDALEQLDRIVIRQQAHLDMLIREVGYLRQHAPEPGTALNLRDELPPHY